MYLVGAAQLCIWMPSAPMHTPGLPLALGWAAIGQGCRPQPQRQAALPARRNQAARLPHTWDTTGTQQHSCTTLG